MPPRHWFPFIVFGLFCARLAGAQDFGRPLSQAQVDCEERQLMRLVHRAVLRTTGFNLFLWRSAPTGGAYRGLAVASYLRGDSLDRETWSREETQMPFDLLLREDEDFLDPRRPRLPQATLVRRDAASNLLADYEVMDLQIDLAQEVPNPLHPRMPLRITNRLAPGAGQADRAARSLLYDDLLSACHAEVTSFDLEVYSILARTVRPTACMLLGSICDGGGFPHKIILFRGSEPLTYRMNVVSYDENCFDDAPCEYIAWTEAYLFRIEVDQHGNLTGGDVRLLDWCTAEGQLACNTSLGPDIALLVMPPLRPGIDKQGPPEFRRSAELQIHYEGYEFNVLYDTINWADLLRDTAWNGGVVP